MGAGAGGREVPRGCGRLGLRTGRFWVQRGRRRVQRARMKVVVSRMLGLKCGDAGVR